MYPDPLSFPSILNEPSQASRSTERAQGGTAFADLYSEAMGAANQELSQILSVDSTDPGDDPLSFLELRAALIPGNCNPFPSASGDFPEMHDELMQHIGAIRAGQRQNATAVSHDSGTPAYVADESISQTAHQNEHGFSFGVHRLISWLDSHAHLHSTHHCAASVRQAMEAAGMQTDDRPASGDAGDYGPFLLRHGAQMISQESYEPRAGDIAVFDRTSDHPAGHIQVFDGQNWVSDFVQHTFSPYRDQESTPPVTVYRLS